ncbi:MAG: hypothetical protein CMO80_01220 [Verrucomicrobiales bacterium]|nr:hypothetical protein [Verrucomicrobiales bacterium]
MDRLSRRAFLRGVGGAAMALPSLDALARTPKTVKPAQRVAFMYVPIGVVRRDFFPGEQDFKVAKYQGTETARWKGPEYATGFRDLQLTPTLKRLAAATDKFTLVTGLDRTFQHGTDVHAQCASCYMSSAAPFAIKRSAWPLDRTLDHLIADEVGGSTPFRTLELSCNSHKDNLESIYFDNISWYGTGHVAPSIRDPRKAYRRLFSTQDIENFRNITDLVLEDAHSLNRELGYSDRQKFEEYFESIRAIEGQMDKLEQMKSELEEAPISEPAAAHLPRSRYIRLMGDLLIAAFQTGLTRVATMMVGPERWNTPFMYDGIFDKPMSHHKMSHNQKTFIDELADVDRFYMDQFAYMLGKMDAIQEADGSSLLDNTVFTYGSGLGDGATHQYEKLPIIVAGRGAGLKNAQGKHLAVPKGTPLANLWLTQARAMGVSRERFADSTGTISQLSG